MPGQYFLIAAGSKTSWSFNWSNYLATDDQGNEVETIDSRLWTISPLHADDQETPKLTGDTSDVCFVSDTRSGMVYELTETIQTSLAVTDSRSITLRCE